MKRVRILMAVGALSLFSMAPPAFAETHDKQCQDAWYKSHAYPTCSGWGWTEKRGDMCLFRQTCSDGGGPKPAKGNTLPGMFEYSQATDGTYSVPLDKVPSLNNCGGVLVVGNCPK